MGKRELKNVTNYKGKSLRVEIDEHLRALGGEVCTCCTNIDKQKFMVRYKQLNFPAKQPEGLIGGKQKVFNTEKEIGLMDRKIKDNQFKEVQKARQEYEREIHKLTRRTQVKTPRQERTSLSTDKMPFMGKSSYGAQFPNHKVVNQLFVKEPEQKFYSVNVPAAPKSTYGQLMSSVADQNKR